MSYGGKEREGMGQRYQYAIVRVKDRGVFDDELKEAVTQ